MYINKKYTRKRNRDLIRKCQLYIILTKLTRKYNKAIDDVHSRLKSKDLYFITFVVSRRCINDYS